MKSTVLLFLHTEQSPSGCSLHGGIINLPLACISSNQLLNFGLKVSRLTVVSREAKKKQHAREPPGPHDHHSEPSTQMAAPKFENAITQPP